MISGGPSTDTEVETSGVNHNYAIDCKHLCYPVTPLASERSNKGGKGTFMNIRDFISVYSRTGTAEESGTVKVGIHLSINETQPAMSKVKVTQYMEASLRILMMT